MTQILEFLGFILEIIIDLVFWRDRKKRRKFEKENNLPKKTMVNPNTLVTIYSIVIILISVILFLMYQHYYSNVKNANKNIIKIQELVIENKEQDGTYPEKLEDIIRNNPLRKNITVDPWGNKYYYKVSENKNTFTLISKGKDGILNTEDDIKSTNK